MSVVTSAPVSTSVSSYYYISSIIHLFFFYSTSSGEVSVVTSAPVISSVPLHPFRLTNDLSPETRYLAGLQREREGGGRERRMEGVVYIWR